MFSRQIQKFARKSKEMTEAVARQSVQDVVERAELTAAQGGAMRVDTGFLRASGGAALGGFPRGPSSNPGGRQFSGSGEAGTGIPLAVALAQWDFEAKLAYGWSASYARPREARDGFMRLAVQNWERIVESNVRAAKAAIR